MATVAVVKLVVVVKSVKRVKRKTRKTRTKMANNLRIDPSRTATAQRRFQGDMVRRFKAVNKKIVELIVTNDSLGLVQNIQAEFWQFESNPDKVKKYRRWLQTQIDNDILSVNIVGDPWTAPYIESNYRKGITRAYTDSKREFSKEHPEAFYATRQQYLETSFSSPVSANKVELLYNRAFTDLEGVTGAMDSQLSGLLANGLAEGRSPAYIARQMSKQIRTLTNTRAKVIARTEMMHAFAEGQLDTFEKLGVDELVVMAEWSTAGDDRVCPLCEPLEATIMTVEEARGMIPRHPNCRCIWIPANVGEKKTGQLWEGKKRTEAIEESIAVSSPGSLWAGKVLV
jgi:SPP1 gp7 family putative phage head morphogenesis protein